MLFDIPGEVPDAVFGPGGLLVRFAWTGAFVSMGLWVLSMVRIWHRESDHHHLVARMTSAIAMIIADVVILLAFWPPNDLLPDIHLNANEARTLIAFFVGAQSMAALYQRTAPRRPQDVNRPLFRWRDRKMPRRRRIRR